MAQSRCSLVTFSHVAEQYPLSGFECLKVPRRSGVEMLAPMVK